MYKFCLRQPSREAEQGRRSRVDQTAAAGACRHVHVCRQVSSSAVCTCVSSSVCQCVVSSCVSSSAEDIPKDISTNLQLVNPSNLVSAG